MNGYFKYFLGALLLSVSLSSWLMGRSFNGFFTPEFVRAEAAPFVPVSVTATLVFGTQITGDLRFRELGSYRVEGSASGDLVNLHLLSNEKLLEGRAMGRRANDWMDLELSLIDAAGLVQSRGKLQLEADAEWRATVAFKAGRDLKDPSLRSWHQPDFDDGEWELVQLPDENSFGNKTPYERLYRSRFLVADPKESVKVTMSQSPPSADAMPTSQESEAVQLIFASDDGIWIYVNGHLLGQWGGRSREGGCVNDPFKRCGVDRTVPPVPVPEAFLHPGENVLAVKVQNGQCCYSYFNLLVTKVRTRLVSP